MDKLVFNGTTTTISNDGATIMKLLDIVHPAARTLVDIARSQDEEVCLCYTQLNQATIASTYIKPTPRTRTCTRTCTRTL
jgi:hypothetical protein